MSTVRFFAILVLTVALSPFATYGQDTPDLAQGLNPYRAYQGGALDSVSIQNGNLTLHIPLFSHPQRGSVSDDWFLIYNNENWQIQQMGAGNLRYLQWVLTGNLGVGVASGRDYFYHRELYKDDPSDHTGYSYL